MADQYLIGNAETLRCRLLLCEGSPDEAAADTPPSLPERHALVRQLEFAATKAMALACCGKTDEARAILSRFDERSQHYEVRDSRTYDDAEASTDRSFLAAFAEEPVVAEPPEPVTLHGRPR
jgi:hypothetical protein